MDIRVTAGNETDLGGIRRQPEFNPSGLRWPVCPCACVPDEQITVITAAR